MTTTPNLNLNVPDYGDQNWNIPINENWLLLDTAIAAKANDSAVVKLTGAQSLSGLKTNAQSYKIKSQWETPYICSYDGVTKGTAPSSTRHMGLCINDGQGDAFGNRLGSYYVSYMDAGIIRTSMVAYKPTAGSTSSERISIEYPSDGDPYTYAPTPATSDNSTKIATTAFIVNVLKAVYPVGSCFIGTTSTCPLASFFGTWTLKSSGRVLQGADSTHIAGTTIEAGLPNITGETYSTNKSAPSHYANTYSGVFRGRNTSETSYYSGYPVSSSDNNVGISFDASRSNSIYGNSTTVQPPAYVVNIWERTA